MTSPVPGLALLVVDVQPVFLNAIPGGARLAEDCRFAAAAAVALGIPVVFVEQRPDKLGGTHEAVRAAAPAAPVFAKSAFSAFGATGLVEWMRDHDIAHLLIAGLETPICVYQTVIAAAAEGIETTVLADAVGGRRPTDCEAARRTLEKKSDCRFLAAETVFYSILGDSGHPAFKAYSALVKARA